MKSKISLFFLTILLFCSCENLWKIDNSASISFKISNLNTVKQENLSLFSIPLGLDDDNTLAVELIDSTNDQVIISKIEPIYNNTAVISFEKIPIVGMDIYAQVFIVNEDKILFGRSESKQIVAGENVLSISNLKDIVVEDEDDDVEYDIIYVLNSGINNPDNPSKYTNDSPIIVLKSPSKAGFTFGGWYTTSTFDGNSVSSIPEGSTGNKTFYAKWNEQGKVTKPTATTKLTYNAEVQTYTPDGFDSNTMELSGETSGTQAKTYTITVALKDKDNSVWEDDNSTADIQLQWEIKQATNNWKIQPSIAGWEEGETPSDPEGEADFGTVVFEYKPVGGVASTNKPTSAGSYFLVASVAENTNYSSITLDVPFEITAPPPVSPTAELEYTWDGITGGYSVKLISGQTGAVIIPDTYVGTEGLKNVTKIVDAGFQDSTITSVVIGNNITVIPANAFKGCVNLNNVTTHSNITDIETWAFHSCTALNSIFIPRSVTSIDANAFFGATSLTIYAEILEVNIPSGWKEFWANINGNDAPILWGQSAP